MMTNSRELRPLLLLPVLVLVLVLVLVAAVLLCMYLLLCNGATLYAFASL